MAAAAQDSLLQWKLGGRAAQVAEPDFIHRGAYGFTDSLPGAANLAVVLEFTMAVVVAAFRDCDRTFQHVEYFGCSNLFRWPSQPVAAIGAPDGRHQTAVCQCLKHFLHGRQGQPGCPGDFGGGAGLTRLMVGQVHQHNRAVIR